jgi:peptide deformylase
MSDTIVFNTEDTLKGTSYAKTVSIPLFNLVGEDNPILKEVMPEFDFKNAPVNPMEFASSLVETCKKHKGYGLSANQCGFRYRVFVMGAEDNFVAFFNPKITATYDESHIVEGCLSFPLLGLRITRPAAVDVEYQDFNGENKTAHYTGISARCFQHELDHMNGIVYTDKAKPLALQQGIKKRNKILKKIRLK